jgi:hypothetical protein
VADCLRKPSAIPAAEGIVRYASIEDGVWDLIGHLIRMSFSYRLRGKEKLIVLWQWLSPFLALSFKAGALHRLDEQMF